MASFNGQLLNTLPDTLIVAGADGSIIWCNSRVLDLLGYEAEAIIGCKIEQLVPDANNNNHQKLREAYVKAPTHRPMGDAAELFAKAKDGVLVPVDIELSPFERDGQPLVMVILRSRAKKLALEQSQQRLLRDNEERLRLSESIIQVGTWDWDVSSDSMMWSDQASRILGIKKSEAPGSYAPCLSLIYEADREAFDQVVVDSLANKVAFSHEFRIKPEGGCLRTLHSICKVYLGQDGEVVRMLGTFRDVSKEHEQKQRQQLAQTVFNYANEGILSTDENYRIVSANPIVEALSGYSRAELLGRHITLLVPKGRIDEYMELCFDKLNSFGNWRGELELQVSNAPATPVLLSMALVRDANQKMQSCVVTLTDISRLKINEAQLEYLAHYDQLTKLPNRALFLNEVASRIDQAKSSTKKLLLAYIDLDGFKQVNDSQGHGAGDQLLIEVAEQLRLVVDSRDVVARIGGDEFAILSEFNSREESDSLAQKIIQYLKIQKDFSDHSLVIGASVGLSCFPDDGEDALDLIKKSDQAMYEAKAGGKNNFRYYDPKLGESLSYRLQLTSDLAQALLKKELSLVFQPKFTVANTKMISAEALVRWNRPGQGDISPLEFVGLAEETGQILELGYQVLEMSLEFLAQWNEKFNKPICLAINLSAKQLYDKNLLSTIAQRLGHYKVAASQLEFEITESVVMLDAEISQDVFSQLRLMGASIAIDDFGTGYSSLSYLKRLPVKTLKIDRSFVSPLPNSVDDVAIVGAIVSMAHSLKLSVVAEGVETQAQRSLLTDMGCDQLQGFYYSKPLLGADFQQRFGADSGVDWPGQS